MLKENLIFEDAESKVIFNHYSFCEIIKWIMVKYGGVSYENATEIIEKSFLVEEPQTYDDVTFMTHELEYHWAMLLLHGQMYWLKGIPSDYNGFEDYKIWETGIKKQYKLKESCQYEELGSIDLCKNDRNE